jgi:hypothetical protein
MRETPSVHLLVSFPRPDGVTPEAALDYVEAAVRNWHGGLQPPDGEVDGDPMFFLNADTVKVRMTNDKMKELATYGAQERLKELDAQRLKIDEEREELMAFLSAPGGPPARVVSESSSRNRKPMSAAARLEASKRMTKIWAKRRKAKRAAATAPVELTPVAPPDTLPEPSPS